MHHSDRTVLRPSMAASYSLLDADEHWVATMPMKLRSHVRARSKSAACDGGLSPNREGARPVVVQDGAMVQLYALVERIAAAPINVLVLGETGVGKEVVAEMIHGRSSRSTAPFVRINCAAIPDSLMESELFGHDRGAFTGAISHKPGLIEAAHGGTVLLDEVGELPLTVQAKLLRVVDTNEVTRVGSVRPRAIDVRFVSATNRDIALDISHGAFRADLFFRLDGITIEVPPLRARPDDILALAQVFLTDAVARTGVADAPQFTPEAVRRLLEHPWPGNVRELRNVVERALLVRSSAEIGPLDLALRPVGATGVARLPLSPVLAPLRRDGERERILDVLNQCLWNQTRSAKQLGMARSTLVRKLAAYDIPRPRKQPSAAAEL